mgnify:CR=1 FL=1
MSQQPVMDPFAIWKNVYEQTETKWNEVIHETMQKEAFSEWMGQVQNAYLQYQQALQNTTDTYLKQVNMPTREDIANVASLVINLEEKVENLDQKLENLEDERTNNPSSTEINRLKSSIARLDKKIETILKAVQQLEVAPTVLQTNTTPDPEPNTNQEENK